MKRISDFDQFAVPKKQDEAFSITKPSKNSIEKVDSLDGLMSDTSLDSFRRFRDSLIDRLQLSADKELTASIECLSNQSEVFSVYKGLESQTKSWNLEKMVDQKGIQIDFVDLFIYRYKQVCKDRKRVKESDLKEFTEKLEMNCNANRRRPQGITNFDNIFNF